MGTVPPGDTGRCLGTSVVVTTGGAPGTEWVGARDVAQHPTAPRRASHPKNDQILTPAVLKGERCPTCLGSRGTRSSLLQTRICVIPTGGKPANYIFLRANDGVSRETALGTPRRQRFLLSERCECGVRVSRQRVSGTSESLDTLNACSLALIPLRTTGGGFCPQGTLGHVWEHLCLSRLGVLLASSGWEPGCSQHPRVPRTAPRRVTARWQPGGALLEGDGIIC